MAKSKVHDDLIIDWGNTDPANWRNLPDPEEENEEDIENDVDVPTPQYVIDMLGFDPDEL